MGCFLGREFIFSPSDELCGLRIIDKSRVHSGKAHVRPAYRLELWFKTSTDHALREEIKKRWTNCLKDGMVARGRKPSALKLDYPGLYGI